MAWQLDGWGPRGASVEQIMPLHAGPPEIFKVVEEHGYVKLVCTLCVATAQLSRCRSKKHMQKLAYRHAEDAVMHMRWASVLGSRQVSELTHEELGYAQSAH